MKKIFLFIILFASTHARAQQLFVKISETYYRSPPFNREFSYFLDRLINDPTLVNKTVHKKTDTTLFFLEGDYTNYQPFFFKNNRTKIIFAEKEELVKDSVESIRTIYVYQLLGYAPPGEEGIKDVQQEFDKFCRRYKKGFDGESYKEITQAGQRSGEVREYKFDDLNFNPLTVAWATSKDHKENVFALTIRFIVYNNLAYLPIPAR